MQAWKDLYLELAEKVSDIDGIKWVDLWHNQVGFLEDEHRFPSPAVFFAFRGLVLEDMANLMQNVRCQVEVYLFYETFADTYAGSVNQESALSFLNLLDELFKALHGQNGENYSEMRRIGFSAVDTGSAGNLYQMVFECSLVEEATKKVYHKADAEDIELKNEAVEPETPDFELPEFEL